MADDSVEVGMVEEVIITTPATLDAGPSSVSQPATAEQNICLLCKTDTGKHLQRLDRGIPTFVTHCQLTGLSDIVNYVSENVTRVYFVHTSCREDLKYKAKKAEKTPHETDLLTRVVTRRTTGTFSFKNMCFYCAESVDFYKPQDVRKVKTGRELDESVRELIVRRNYDDWSVAVLGRLESITDLFASDAVYHIKCSTRFSQCLPHTPRKRKRGRPVNEEAKAAFEELCDQLETSGENELYTLDILHEMMCEIAGIDETSSVYSKGYLQNLLETRYGDHIYFASQPGRANVVGFRNFCSFLIQDQFRSNVETGCSESERIVKKAAALILADIREYSYNKDFYPSPDDVQGEGLQFVPPLLRLFLGKLVPAELKQSSLGQAVVQAARPRGCLMPLLFAAAVDIDKSGNRHLHDTVSRLGFCLSYDEIRRFKYSIMSSLPSYEYDEQTNIGKEELFTQYVADNFDHNLHTLDGHGTFHGMGIISATVSPKGSFGIAAQRIQRLTTPLKADEVTKHRSAPILSYHPAKCTGLEAVPLVSIRLLQQPLAFPKTKSLTALWQCAGMFSSSLRPRPNWSGYMQTVCIGERPSSSSVEMLAIIDLKSSDENCIYSTLEFVIKQASHHNIPVPCLTFDQPLYIKALDIVKKTNMNVVLRLGGFHTLMNFLGAIGFLMKGSGLEEVFGLIFGSNTIEHILSDKAYARALRGHFLVDSALNALLLNFLKEPLQTESECGEEVVILDDGDNCKLLAGCISEIMAADLECLYNSTLESKVDIHDNELNQSQSLSFISQRLEHLKALLSAQCRTARLWVSYMTYIDIVRDFILAERTGHWALHVDTVRSMLPLLGATGHSHYTKTARIYVQEMQELQVKHPWLYEQFVVGHHAIRRSDRVWSGLSSDLVIEQTMMRAGKSTGGLTRGRGMEESVKTTWISTLLDCSSIHAALSRVTGTDCSIEEHKEVGVSRMKRDYGDFYKLRCYFLQNSPFRFADNDRLISISTGVSTTADDGVNCDEAEKVGLEILQQWDNCQYGLVKLSKADRVKTMDLLSATCSIQHEKISVDPNNLFHRLVLVGERTDSIRDCFSFELTPYPMSLFKGNFMRKPDKPALYRETLKDLSRATLPSDINYVIDGGYMLHKVRWQTSCNVSDILPLYYNFICRFGPDVSVVFDGYDDEMLSTKAHEHERREGKTSRVSPTQLVDFNTRQIGAQEAFLANINNKKCFIKLLMQFLSAQGVSACQATGDADTHIVSVALDKAVTIGKVAVLAEDTDILVLLLHHWREQMNDVYFVSEAKKGKGGKHIESKCISIPAARRHLGTNACDCLPAIHSFTGCDTTSSIFGHGKGSLYTCLTNIQLQEHCVTLQSESATLEQVIAAGISLMIAVYGGKESDTLSALRYSQYCTLSLSRRFQTERLPPSNDATSLHSMRVHWQAVVWCTLGRSSISATEWGWKVYNNKLVPIQLQGPVAPDNMLSVIRCQCRTDCSKLTCSCRKHGLQCVSACGRCRGISCMNVAVDTNDDGSKNDTVSCESLLEVEQSQLIWDVEIGYMYEEEV